ncbi:MAG TPA: ABC transporter ATP-binding protein [Syntrophobacteria bacterium]|nr:ABC transporter ATP-binding protein [Syntrophobacteria bacterium]
MEPIRIEGLVKVYKKGLRRQKVLAVDDLHLTVAAGEIFGFLGPNGAGKSTTIKILCDLIRPTKGRATILGRDVRDPEARRQMGYLPENPNYYSFLTAWELLRFHGELHGMVETAFRSRGEELIAAVELADAAHRPLRTYSKGMVQRLGIAAALIRDPQLLILDEPMSGLDPLGRRLVIDIMADLRRRGKTIFFSTHILADVETICDRIGVIVQGKLVYEGHMETVRSSAIKHYEIIFDGDPARISSFPWPAGEAPTRQADLFVLDVRPDRFETAVRSILDQRFRITRIEPKRQRLEELFVDLAGGP